MKHQFQIIPAKPYHCGQIVRRLRHDMHCAFFALGLDAHKELRICFDASYFRRAWFIDGKLEGIGGIFGSEMSSTGYIWLAVSEEATHYPVAMLKEARKQMAEIAGTKRSLIASSLRKDEAAERFLSHLGFAPRGKFHADAEGWMWRRQDETREAA